ncbi:hypothetical protein HPB49_019071 [Dermacentor silvarum]|uniref:Uncharacterized protein n=1 Tax=Dermacentor silvarum TaxID=543639 RepID=A0ACB8CMF8_DERSI|nr:hypothetical protein HPB49_019071 [Dermacentor silvarum]
MLREIPSRDLPPDLVLKFHELYELTKASTAALTNEAEVDSEHRMTKAEKELQSLVEYFDHQLQCREAVTTYTSGKTPEVQKNRDTSRTVQHRNVSSTADLQNVLEKHDLGLFCKSSRHSAEVCYNKEVNLTYKKQILTKAGRCFRCLKQGHMASDCRGRRRCDRCSRRHVTSMCNPDFKKEENEASATAVNLLSQQASPVILQSLTARVAGTTSSKHCRIFFDCGSQRSFITIDASRTLGFQFLQE